VAVTMICPNLKCGRTVVAPEGARGKVVRCGHCQQLFMVPVTHAPEAPPSAPVEAEEETPKRRNGR
jgi:predicted Zn finger-like uncharacterized protein